MLYLTAVFVALLTYCGIAYGQLGLTRLPSTDVNVCSSNVTYVCITNGLGTSEFNSSGDVIRIRHSQFPEGTPGTSVRTEGDLTATNLLRSFNKTCNDTSDDSCYTYMTELIVRVTNRTLCQVITCSRTFSATVTQFGQDLIQWLFPPPSNVEVVKRSMNSTTVSWGSDATDCSDIMYAIRTSKCGNCSSIITTTETSITCGNLMAEDQCNVTVQTILECGGYSDPRLVTVPPFTRPMSGSNPLAVPLGVSLPIIVVVMVGISVAVAAFCIYRDRKKKSTMRRGTTTGVHVALQESGITECLKRPEAEEGSAESEALQLSQPDQSITKQQGEKETEALIVSSPKGVKPVTESLTQPTSAFTRGMEQMEIASGIDYFFGQVEIKPNADDHEPTVEKVVKNAEKDEANNVPQSKPGLTIGGKMLAQVLDTEPDCHSEEVKPLKPERADGRSQPSTSSSEESDTDSRKGLMPEETGGPFLHVATERNYASAETADPLSDIKERLNNLEADRHCSNERITQLETNCKTHETRIEALNGKISQLEDELSKMKTKCASLEQLNEEERKRHKKREKELKNQIQEERAQKEQLIRELAEARALLKQQQNPKTQDC